MNENISKKAVAVALAGLVCAGLLTFFYLGRGDDGLGSGGESGSEAGTPQGKAAAATIDDGEYYVYVKSLGESPEDMVFRMQHVTYFEGEEARLSAEREVPCQGRAIESCVPTLLKGYYVRESGAPEFSAPVSRQAGVRLAEGGGSLDGLRQRLNTASHRPAFRIEIRNGMIVMIEERAGNK